jgi:hypothetical protein
MDRGSVRRCATAVHLPDRRLTTMDRSARIEIGIAVLGE